MPTLEDVGRLKMLTLFEKANPMGVAFKGEDEEKLWYLTFA